MDAQPNPAHPFLRRRVTVEQVEAAWAAESSSSGRVADRAKRRGRKHKKDERKRRAQLRKTMGFGNARWESLKRQIQTGDELWEFDTPREFWDQLMGMAGLALVRDGKIVAFVMTRMN